LSPAALKTVSEIKKPSVHAIKDRKSEDRKDFSLSPTPLPQRERGFEGGVAKITHFIREVIGEMLVT